ncbi:hypothetical protein GALL_227230 [mine drainage metagenome]|uniref:GNAT family N-acetyltransferase n=1 Tax=mine drainage metagenome TaxID=410659 RepID=A0A1J5S4H6_9ZZZZ
MESVGIIESLNDVDEAEWNILAGSNPFLQHYFLKALEETGCAITSTGWTQQFILLHRDKALVGAAPLYLKTHSRGEFVFDYAWADAYERYGLPYYPKAVVAVPFTPVTGPRLLAKSHSDKLALAKAAIHYTEKLGISSIHVLFPDSSDLAALKEAGYSIREGVQFHWNNHNYQDFNEFISSMNHEKRKKIRQARKKIFESEVSFRWLLGSEITNEYLEYFYYCYSKTYAEHRSQPYLSLEFFQRILNASPESILMIIALIDGKPIASALNILGGGCLYGRYWGCTEFISGLHFETCYLQAIEYCIQNNIEIFEGGAQGEHKIARGLLPTKTFSAHWISDSRFADAIDRFLDEESNAMKEYVKELEASTPFRRIDN